VTRLEADAGDPLALRWNPDGLGFGRVLSELGLRSGTVAVTGGTAVFDLFLSLGYHRFVLSTATSVTLPAGRPCFSGGRAEAVLERAGLRPGPGSLIDPQAGVTRTVWSRA